MPGSRENNTDGSPRLRFAVLQPGARLHYAVPTLLARAGMLQRLYTDLCADLPPLPALDRLWPSALRPKPVHRLFGRRLPPEIPRDSVRHLAVATLTHDLCKRLRWVNSASDSEYALIDLVRRDRFGGADALYTTLINSDLDLVREAQEEGIKVVHEVMIGPDVGWWLHEEQVRFPGFEEIADTDAILEGTRRDAAKYQLAELILVPSEFVRRSVERLGANPERVATVPYGLDQAWFDQVSCPMNGQVLFVGSVGLRKGNHYLAEATRILQRRRVPCEVRVVGPCDSATVARPEFRGPNYVGQVPRSSVVEEFKRADVFALPTLCDSFALVHLEAMACGVPVITTPNCGSVVRDGVDGFIVPIRDAEALAEKIEFLVTDRPLRERMSRNARERAKEFTWDRYGERLIQALSRLSH